MVYISTYEKTPGSKGLITYEKQELTVKQSIIKEWENIFIDESTEYIDGPVLIPMTYLERSGHLSKFNKDSEEIYLVKPNLALRPETCATIFAYYLSKYGRRPVDTSIAQVGKSFRNEKSTRNLEYRVNEFYQLEIEAIEVNSQTVPLILNGVTYKVKPKLNRLYQLSKKFFNVLQIPVKYVPIEDRAFYSEFTLDIFVEVNGVNVELGCINDRSNHDIAKSVYVSELSIGLHRLIIYKTRVDNIQ